jgi:hypothetical protein
MYGKKLILVAVFAVAMAYFEAAVVVYLRELFHPEGFAFPLKAVPGRQIIVELLREIATMIMLITVAAMSGRKFWERFGYFLILFGIWDIFYYIWLRVAVGWPSSFLEWDILFLIPLPWIAPVIAPVAVAVLMLIIGLSITRLYYKGFSFEPTLRSWILAAAATAMILFSFMYDLDATLHFQMPRPYLYWLLISGLALYVVAYLHSYEKTRKH